MEGKKIEQPQWLSMLTEEHVEKFSNYKWNQAQFKTED